MRKFDSDDQIADKRLEQVLKALKLQDKDALKSMFSKKALGEAKDINTNIDYVYTIFEGKVISYSRRNGGGALVDESYANGKGTKEVKSWYDVVTDKENYIFFILDYPVDTNNPDNVGLYSLRVVKAEDRDTQLSYWQNMKIPGIYRPKES